MSEAKKAHVTVMEEQRDGKKFGWLSRTCATCKGCGVTYSKAYDVDMSCSGCGGTGEAYGEITEK